MNEMLGRFLRDRRARLTLEQAGLPSRRSGRSATLTQEDLARLTGFSIRTVSALEQGAEHRPSPELLEAISAALRLDPAERRTLWQLATGSAPPDASYVPDPDPHLARMVDLLDPHPSYVCDALYNMQAHNDAFGRWVRDFSTAPPQERNLARFLILDPHAKHLLPFWLRDLAGLVARIRTVHMRLPGNDELNDLIKDLLADGDFRRFWAAGTDIAEYATVHPLVFREPGFTDPAQPDDARHHVPLTMTALTPTAAGDNRRFVTMLLPEGYRPATGGSPCGACAAAG